MLDGHLLVDAHVHVPQLDSLAPAWIEWARSFGAPGILEQIWRPDGTPDPAALDRLFGGEGVDVALYPAYGILVERGVPLVVHSGTSSFPGSTNAFADPMHLDAVLRDFPDLQVVLAHGGRGWWYDAAAFLAVSRPNVWIELSGLPPKRLPEYYSRFDLHRLARKWIYATDWPGVPGQAANARAVASLGLPDDVVPLVLGGNALRVYSGLEPATS
jgi:predicted TIM-barrel fold metal-dependent hydrolase